MRPLLLFIACAAVIATTACNAQVDSTRSVRSFRTSSTLPTAVGETLAVRVSAFGDGSYDLSSFDYELGAATCDLRDCAAAVDQSTKTVYVRSDTPGIARVLVAVKGSATTIELMVPFRVVTRILMTRAMVDSPAGSAFATVTGDLQTWRVTAGDDDGPLVAPVGVVVGPTAMAQDASAVCFPDGSIPYGEPTWTICRFKSDTPTSFDVTGSYKSVTRTETVKVVPLAAVRSASLLVCHTKTHPVPGSTGLPIPERIDVATISTPCEPVTSLHYPSPSCRTARDWKVVPRLVLDDGSIALGGDQYLSTDVGGAEAAGDIDYMTSGSGHIIGRFGDAAVSVPYSVDDYAASCAP